MRNGDEVGVPSGDFIERVFLKDDYVGESRALAELLKGREAGGGWDQHVARLSCCFLILESLREARVF